MIPHNCPNCHSPDYIRTVRNERLTHLFWRDPIETVTVECLQCNEIIYSYNPKSSMHEINKK